MICPACRYEINGNIALHTLTNSNGEIGIECNHCMHFIREKKVSMRFFLALNNLKRNLGKLFYKKMFFEIGKNFSIKPGFSCTHGNIIVGDNCALGNATLIDTCLIRIGDNSFFGHDVMLITDGHQIDNINTNMNGTERCGATHGMSGPITIGKAVWLSSRSIVLKGVTIGDCAVVAAGAVVTKDVEPYTLVAGVPARPIRKLTSGNGY